MRMAWTSCHTNNSRGAQRRGSNLVGSGTELPHGSSQEEIVKKGGNQSHDLSKYMRGGGKTLYKSSKTPTIRREWVERGT